MERSASDGRPQSAAEHLWYLLDDVEDYLRGGFRHRHSSPVIRATQGSIDQRSAAGQAAQAPAAMARPARSSAGSPAERSTATGSDATARPVGATDDDLSARKGRLAAVEKRITSCALCRLHEGRRNTVPGVGVFDPLTMVIGEGPGADEDAQGLPFVGRAGQYLDKWLDAIQLSRHRNAYIANVVKCRPPGNRDPQPDESEACHPYLIEQIDIIRPKTILTVGRIASQMLVGRLESLGSLRGRVYEFRGIPLVVTYHPSGVLRNPEYRRPVWEDLKLLRQVIDGEPAAGESPDSGNNG